VLFLIDSLGMGGAERTLATTLHFIDRELVEPRVCVLQERDGNPVAESIREFGIPVDTVPVKRLRDLSAPVRLRRYVRRHRIDLIHCHLGFAVSIGGPVGASLGIPVVATNHTFNEPAPGSRESYRMAVHRWSLRNMHASVIAVSEAGRRHVVETVPLAGDKVRVVYNGVDIDRFDAIDPSTRTTIRSGFGIPAESPLVTTVSVLRPEKGIADLLEAMTLILESAPDTHLLVVGDGEDRERLVRLTASLSLDDRVRFAGHRDDVPQILAASDVFVLPTLGDVLPTSVAEAMAAGLPVVASDVGGLAEMVEDGVTGFLVPPGSPTGIADRCLVLINDPPQRELLGNRGRDRAVERFDVRRQTATLVSLYRALLELPR
jgi:glycosyltransferase involved in cell wall biosynthesis